MDALEGRMDVSGDAVGVFVRSGRAWVELSHTDAQPLERAGVLRAMSPIAPSATVVHGQTVVPPEPIVGTRTAPTRMGDLFEASFSGTLFLTVGDLGVGGIGHGSFVRRFEAPVALRAEVSPAAFGVGRNDSAGVVTGVALVSVDTQLFEVGLGVGGGAVPGRFSYGTSSPTQALPAPVVSDRSTIVLPSLIRIGARDGLSAVVRTNVIVRNELFAFGSVDVLGQRPVGDR